MPVLGWKGFSYTGKGFGIRICSRLTGLHKLQPTLRPDDLTGIRFFEGMDQHRRIVGRKYPVKLAGVSAFFDFYVHIKPLAEDFLQVGRTGVFQYNFPVLPGGVVFHVYVRSWRAAPMSASTQPVHRVS